MFFLCVFELFFIRESRSNFKKLLKRCPCFLIIHMWMETAFSFWFFFSSGVFFIFELWFSSGFCCTQLWTVIHFNAFSTFIPIPLIFIQSPTFEMILVRKTLSVSFISQSVCLLTTVKAISIRCEDLFVVWHAIHVYFCHLMTLFFKINVFWYRFMSISLQKKHPIITLFSTSYSPTFVCITRFTAASVNNKMEKSIICFFIKRSLLT